MNNPFEVIEARLNSIENLMLNFKPPIKVEPNELSEHWLDLNELVQYDPEKRTKSTWYSKISRKEVPFYKRDKKVYFLKSEIDEWLKQGKWKSNLEIDQEANIYFSNKSGGRK